MHLLKISTLAISSLTLTSATQLAELLRFKPESSSAVTPAGPESIFSSHVPSSTKVPDDGASENLEYVFYSVRMLVTGGMYLTLIWFCLG